MNGLLFHREDGPAYISWDEDGGLRIIEYYIYNKYHRLDGPALQIWSKCSLVKEKYYFHGQECSSLKDLKKIIKLSPFK